MISHETLTVGTSATQIYTASGPEAVWLFVPGTVTGDVYLGTSGVTTSDYGLRLAPGDTSPRLPLRNGDTIFAVNDSGGSVDVQLMAITNATY